MEGLRRFLRSFAGRLLLIALAGLAVRVGFTVVARADQPLKLSDSAYYHYQGELLADGEGFPEPFLARREPQSIEAPGGAHPPLYSLYLAFWSVQDFNSPLAHRLASCLVGAGAVAVIGLTARRIAGNRAGLLAAALAAVYGNLWINDAMLAAESLFALTVAWTLYATYTLWKEPTGWHAILFGVATAAAALTRAEAILYFPLLLIPVALSRRALPMRKRFDLVVIGGVVGALLMGPWVLYNLSRFEKPTYLSVGSGYTLMLGNCDETYDFSTNRVGYWSFACGQTEPPPGVYDQSVLEVEYRERGLEYIREHLDEYPVIVGVRILRVFDLFRPWENIGLNWFIERRGLWPARIATLMYYMLSALSLYALWVLRRRRVIIWPFVVIFAVICFTMFVAFGITRYRVPWDVALVILGGVALDDLLKSGPRPHRRTVVSERGGAESSEHGAPSGREAGIPPSSEGRP